MSQHILADLTLGLETVLQPEKIAAWLEGQRAGTLATSSLLKGVVLHLVMEPHHYWGSPLSQYLNAQLETAEYQYWNRMHQSISPCIKVMYKVPGLTEQGWRGVLSYTPQTWVMDFCRECGKYHKSSWWDAPDRISIDEALTALAAAQPEDTWLDCFALDSVTSDVGQSDQRRWTE